MKSSEEVTKEVIEKGGVLLNLYFDVHGKEKEKVEGLLVDLADRILKEKGVVYAVGEIERAMDFGDGLYSAAIKLKVLAKSFNDVVRICMLYGPMGIEILEPNELKLKLYEMQDILMDVSQMSYEFTTAMLYRVLSDEEKIDLQRKIDLRAKFGKEILEKFKKDEKKDDNKSETK